MAKKAVTQSDIEKARKGAKPKKAKAKKMRMPKQKRSNPSMKFANRKVDTSNNNLDANLSARVIRIVKGFPKTTGTINAKSSKGKAYSYQGKVIANATQRADAGKALGNVAKLRRSKSEAEVRAARKAINDFITKYA